MLLSTVLLAAAALSIGAVASEPVEPSGKVVVIRLAFPQGDPCELDVDADVDGNGVWEMGAPCQRHSQNPTRWWCWQEPEDLCYEISDQQLTPKDGECTETPCKLSYTFKLSYDEPCVEPTCDNIKCCDSGTYRILEGHGQLLYHVGQVASGSSKTMTAVTLCDCSATKDNECNMRVNITCVEFGPYEYYVNHIGYDFTCKECE